MFQVHAYILSQWMGNIERVCAVFGPVHQTNVPLFWMATHSMRNLLSIVHTTHTAKVEGLV